MQVINNRGPNTVGRHLKGTETQIKVSLLEVQVGGLENVGFVRRDVYNYARDVHGEVIGHDAELLNEHFLAEKGKHESFYFNMEVDSEGRMGNVFWADARQTVLFGYAFLTSETTDSFVWLFEEFKKAMPDHVDTNEKPPLPFRTPMQHQMARIYTQGILEMFEREDFRSLLCLFELGEQDETQCRYKVSERVNPGVTRMKELVHDKDADKAYCSCKGFEFWGIPCRHILVFLRMK
ncbi:protein FAR1-RELATED SEQUENCE 5-like [Prunus avium]|uniref:Protein FAR1-RELATED SEQUENCE 5-like n=1 Tax=Prunus avium TaxID=42229 RepID=A0A6P5T848_PRUAV|nr:protein FAR1-RELATED SEQUENCE 5-like [Prunus avium]